MLRLDRDVLTPYRILVVDDEWDNRIVIHRLLRLYGAQEPELARNGDEGLAFLRRQQFDVILLDILMPELSGWEVLRWMRRLPNGLKGKARIFAVTALKEVTEAKVLEAGFDGFLAKPLDYRLLVSHIHTQLKGT